MRNKVVSDLLNKVKEFNDFFSEYEKEFYPKAVKLRNKFLISLITSFILIGISSVFLGVLGFLELGIFFLTLTLTTVGCSIYFGVKFNDASDGKLNRFEELCREVNASLIYKYGEKASDIVNMLIVDLTDKKNTQVKQYEKGVKVVGTVGMVLVNFVITLILNKLFGLEENNILFKLLIGFIVVVFAVIFLMQILDIFIKNLIKYPVFGKASKEVYLIDILYEVKYMVLEKENI